MRPETLLEQLLGSPTVRLNALPTDQGIYALYDHEGVARYIGVTEMGLRRRIHDYHVGGDGNSHKFSTIYNAGRMFHTRGDLFTHAGDGRAAKELRRMFSRRYCGAVGIPLPQCSKTELYALETQVRRLAPKHALSWNDARALDSYEPTELLNDFLKEIGWPSAKSEAIARQAGRWGQKLAAATAPGDV